MNQPPKKSVSGSVPAARKGGFSADAFKMAGNKFKNARPFKPNGKKPINRPK